MNKCPIDNLLFMGTWVSDIGAVEMHVEGKA